MVRFRKSSGSVLLLVLPLTGALFLLAFFGLSTNGLLFNRSSEQDKADALSLKLACELNKDDRIGQFNQLQSRCRELVFCSRQNLRLCREKELTFIEPLCDELMIESRDGYRLLEKERQNLIRSICLDLQNAAYRYNREAEGEGGFKFALMQTDRPTIQRIELGVLRGVQSNVMLNDKVPDLAAFDLSHANVLPHSHLFKADQYARLPDQDADLGFKFSSLPANINDSLAQARNFNLELFHSSACILDHSDNRSDLPEELPGAVKVDCSMRAALGEKRELEGRLTASSCALSHGAVAPCDE